MNNSYDRLPGSRVLKTHYTCCRNFKGTFHDSIMAMKKFPTTTVCHFVYLIHQADGCCGAMACIKIMHISVPTLLINALYSNSCTDFGSSAPAHICAGPHMHAYTLAKPLSWCSKRLTCSRLTHTCACSHYLYGPYEAWLKM